MHYTPAQTRWFLSAIDKAEGAHAATQRIHHVVDTRVASLMDGATVTKHVKSIVADAEGLHG